MSIRKNLIRVWLALSLTSILVDVACFWLVQHSNAPLPGNYRVNYITIFLISAPAPLALAVVLTFLGVVIAVLRAIWRLSRRAAQRQPADYVLARPIEPAVESIENQRISNDAAHFPHAVRAVLDQPTSRAY